MVFELLVGTGILLRKEDHGLNILSANCKIVTN